jgi:hypothetical protein
MSLVSLKTDLKNLKYGKDTLGGGYSGQPYIQTKIPEDFNDLGAREDFILRGGANAARDTITDIQRLTKMFFDLKSPNGVLFIAKQNLLSQTAVRTQTSGIVNEGIYTPLNTLAQAGVIATGGHLNKQGLNPFAETGAYSNNNNLYGVKVKSTQPTGENRLAELYRLSFTNNGQASDKLNGFILNDTINVLSYNGGPDSILGVGKTNIRYTNQRTGINNYQSKNPNLQSYFLGKNQKIVEPGDYLKNIGVSIKDNGVSGKYSRLAGSIGGFLENGYNNEGLPYGVYNFNVYEPAIEGNTWPKNSPLIYNNNTFTYNQKDIINSNLNPVGIKNNHGSPKIQDFRKILRSKIQGTQRIKAEQTGATPESPNYNTKNIENRILLGDPGQRADKSYVNYEKGVQTINNTPFYKSINTPLGTYKPGLDKITSVPIYRSQNVASSEYVNDLVKFRIAVIDNDSPSFKTFIHFRAFLDSMSDSYNSTWNGFNYLGRGEQFYTYGGFTRTLSLSWTVAAQSKQELIPMYKKLNYLASSLTPDYSPNGYMRGNLVQLTVGGYVYEQPGFITALTYDVPSESPWEIGIGSNENGNEDGTVKELPHIIKVTGFSFTPIQRFIPQLQNNGFGSTNSISGSGFVNNYGPERYIALANGNNEKNNNYNVFDTNNSNRRN